jgi:uncharacterized membrane protein YgcG
MNMEYISTMNFTSSKGKKYYRGTVINNSEYLLLNYNDRRMFKVKESFNNDSKNNDNYLNGTTGSYYDYSSPSYDNSSSSNNDSSSSFDGFGGGGDFGGGGASSDW